MLASSSMNSHKRCTCSLGLLSVWCPLWCSTSGWWHLRVPLYEGHSDPAGCTAGPPLRPSWGIQRSLPLGPVSWVACSVAAGLWWWCGAQAVGMVGVWTGGWSPVGLSWTVGHHGLGEAVVVVFHCWEQDPKWARLWTSHGAHFFLTCQKQVKEQGLAQGQEAGCPWLPSGCAHMPMSSNASLLTLYWIMVAFLPKFSQVIPKVQPSVQGLWSWVALGELLGGQEEHGGLVYFSLFYDFHFFFWVMFFIAIFEACWERLH